MCNNSTHGLHICIYLNGCRVKFIFCPHVYCLQTLSSTWVDILKPRGFKHEFTHRLNNITYNWEIKRLFNTCIHVYTRTHVCMCAHTHTDTNYVYNNSDLFMQNTFSYQSFDQDLHYFLYSC